MAKRALGNDFPTCSLDILSLHLGAESQQTPKSPPYGIRGTAGSITYSSIKIEGWIWLRVTSVLPGCPEYGQLEHLWEVVVHSFPVSNKQYDDFVFGLDLFRIWLGSRLLVCPKNQTDAAAFQPCMGRLQVQLVSFSFFVLPVRPASSGPWQHLGAAEP